MTAYRLLGPLHPDVPGPRVRVLLARLALDPGRVVPREALIDSIWGELPPADSTNALQTLVSRLRRAVGAESVVSHPAGYQLATPAADVDVGTFEQLLGVARSTADPAAARTAYSSALALWTGPPLAGLDAPFVPEAVTRLLELRAGAVEGDAAAAVALGRGDEVVAGLRALCVEQPLRERAHALLVTALAASGRVADALAVFEGVRRRLSDELGVDPSDELAQAHLAVLRGEVTATAPVPRRHQPLRSYLTGFVGREQALADLETAVQASRLVTLLGPGGVGKTRLSVEAAGHYPGATVRMVELAPVATDGDVLGAVLSALQLRESTMLDVAVLETGEGLERLVEHLAGAASVLVMDNCEHVTAQVAGLVAALLAECPLLRVVATSREPLGLTGEVIVPLAPLDLATAVALLEQRAAAVRPGLALDAALAERVCERLDRMPLAIELAAARLRAMTLGQLADRLDDRFRLLSAGDPTVAARHRSLRGVIDWSWDLLPARERLVLARLSVFSAPVSVAGAQAVCSGEGVAAEEVADALAGLAEQSLLVAGPDGTYAMLETVREYARERLTDAGDLERRRSRHTAYYLELAEATEPLLRTRGQRDALELLRNEREDLLLALDSAVKAGDAAVAVRLSAALSWMWTLLGRHSEATREIGRALALPGETTTGARAVALAVWAMSSATSHDVGNLRDHFAEVARLTAITPVEQRNPVLVLSGALAALVADDHARVVAATSSALALDGVGVWERAALHLMLSFSAENCGDVAGQRAALTLASAEFEQIGDSWGIAMSLTQLAAVHALDGELTGAIQDCRRALRLLEELHADDDSVYLRVRIAMLQAAAGDTVSARAWAEEVLESGRFEPGGVSPVLAVYLLVELDLGDGDLDRARMRLPLARQLSVVGARGGPPQLKALLLGVEAAVVGAEGDRERAWALLAEGLEAALASHDMPVVADLAAVVAMQCLTEGDPAAAMRALGAAAGLRGTPDRGSIRVARVSAAARGQLGEEAATTAYEYGRALSRDDALALLRSPP